MNLDELKILWQQQHEQVTKTNEQLLRTMLEHRSSDAIGRMLTLEYLSTSIATIVLLVLLISLPLFNGVAMMVAFAVSTIITVASLIWQVYKIRLLRSIHFGDSPVALIAERLEQFRLVITREKIISFFVVPVLMAALIPLAHRLVRGDSAFLYLNMYSIRLLLGYLAYVVLCIFWYGRLYFRNIEAIGRHLAEIRAFREAK